MHIMESPVEGVKRDFAGLELDTDKVLLHSANKQKIMPPYLGELPDDLKDGGDAFITVVITNSLYARVALVIKSGRKKHNFPVEATTQKIEPLLFWLLFCQKPSEETRFYTNWGCGLSKHALGFYQGCFSYWQRLIAKGLGVDDLIRQIPSNQLDFLAQFIDELRETA